MMALRFAVHRLATTYILFNMSGTASVQEWEACKSIVHSTRISARGIAKVLSEMHVSGRREETWGTPLVLAIRKQYWAFVKWLLDFGACPNLGESTSRCGTLRVYCAMITTCRKVPPLMGDVLQLAGALNVFNSQGSMDGKVLAEWERYHRAERIAWMQAVARRTQV